MSGTHQGSCLCQAVMYKTEGPLRPVIACHCQQCRKASGHYVSATSAPRDAIEIIGDVTWFLSSETARRGFCGTCGSNLFWDGGGANMSIHAGSFDGPLGLETLGHIFCADKGDYYEIPEGYRKSDAADPALTTWVPA